MLVNGHMSRVMRKPVFGFSNQVQHKLSCIATEDGKKLEISDLERNLCSKNKGATTQLICAFVLAYAISRFPHDAAHMCMFRG